MIEYKAFMKELLDDPVRLKKFVRELMGPPRRVIEGTEKEHLMTVLSLLTPTSDSNNQRTWTSVYHHAGKEYHFTSGAGFDELEEILPDDIQ